MKKSRLTVINSFLIVLLILTASSSLILECIGGKDLPTLRSVTLVVVHIIVTLALVLLSYLHIRAHFGSLPQWRQRFGKTKRQNRWLLWTTVLTFLTGIVAIVTFALKGHSSFGGIHGKIGYVALLIMFLHLIHRGKWLRNLF